MSPPEILTLVLVVGWAAFALGCWLTKRALRSEINYQRVMAATWYQKWQAERDAGEWWKGN